MKRKSNSLSARYLTRGAVIAALYVAITFLVSLIGLDKGPIQLRLSEALCILPAFMPEAVGGLYIGCLLANLLTAANVWDVIFGSLATLIGALGARALRRVPTQFGWLIPLPTVVANSFIVPLVLKHAYGVDGAYLFLLVTVAIGELLSAELLGTALYHYLTKRDDKLR